ncbi:MAG: rod shape-determining protein MreC, partial [Solirubrobacterales bacterium]|nr:rod shape-determining protein MreC [Solirubrobacterales bacterium]
MPDKYVRRRRALIGILVVIALILLTDYFGEAENSPLHSIQQGIVEIFTPIQNGAAKVFSPVRDLAGWVSSTVHAKSQNSELQHEVSGLRSMQGRYQAMANQNAQLLALNHLSNRLNLGQYAPVTANVSEFNPEVWYETIRVDKGSGAGVKIGDPVISGEGLVGNVSSVGGNYAVVSELSAPKFSAGVNIQDGSRFAPGTLSPAVGNPTTLQVNYLRASDQIQNGDLVVTNGFSEPNNPQVHSLY